MTETTSCTIELINVELNESVYVFQSHYIPRIGETIFITNQSGIHWDHVRYSGRVIDVRYKWGPESKCMVVEVIAQENIE